MSTWIEPSLFERLSVPQNNIFYVTEMDPRWRDHPLEVGLHSELYDYFLSGGQLLHRTNVQGEVELFVLLNEVEPHLVENSRWGVEIVEASNQRFVLHMVVYDRDDDPLKLPFIFTLKNMNERYNAAAICEQQSISVYFLDLHEGELIVCFSKYISWPEQIRNNMRNAVLHSYFSQDDSSISDDDLTANGWTYQFDKSKLAEDYGIDGCTDYITGKMLEATEILKKHRLKGVKKGPFLFWLAEKKLLRSNQWVDGIVVFVTPFYSERVRGNSDVEPCYPFFLKCNGFIRTESGNSIFEGAVPMFKFEDGKVTDILLTSSLVNRMASVYDQIAQWNPGANNNNRYKALLRQEG
jgi:hypothetical protein